MSAPIAVLERSPQSWNGMVLRAAGRINGSQADVTEKCGSRSVERCGTRVQQPVQQQPDR
jgi:hypothetical protein